MFVIYYMALKKAGVLTLLLIFALLAFIVFLVLPEAVEEEPIHILVRLFGLFGYVFLSITTLTTPFLKEVTMAFGKSFLRIHHIFAALGAVFITLHPVFNAIERLSIAVFIPNFSSWNAFWALAGRPALIILYVAVFAAFLRTRTPRYWRLFHALMYVVLLFGIVHAFLIGDDFQNQWVAAIFTSLFILSIAGFVIKRARTYLGRKQKAQ